MEDAFGDHTAHSPLYFNVCAGLPFSLVYSFVSNFIQLIHTCCGVQLSSKLSSYAKQLVMFKRSICSLCQSLNSIIFSTFDSIQQLQLLGSPRPRPFPSPLTSPSDLHQLAKGRFEFTISFSPSILTYMQKMRCGRCIMGFNVGATLLQKAFP